ncbi:helix-turn-helix transcriptional regulator [Streptomyces olivaceus]|uniref:helix-turn-helix domain-containing protein n=1 Tax=Streptomyces TaxID=1883 RepID=UPI001CCDFE9A|nr:MULTISPECIES: helix-turn-helix transcriptional regulator [Streptomyces]MBZ6171932.1 helix-turn-helix transcriptional regulator [Streptomyces olivaceus]MBZ6183128.1 helix-turn-helix transcriptional regulator [Streptomyces olivaceus]MBZ6256995.1 helix-turn-helix transcriptional regulator [Streptomyces olivaceus]WFB85045.1 helix-turn-helix transcriptional regulator [Streptomyces olivaceus]WGK49332.1 helix-turn-helix transcriptional regulator [Streptomyces sp. B146]
MPDSAGGVETLCGGGEPERSDSLRTFGEVVKAFRKRAGLTQEEFAPRVRYSLPTVASIEQGRRFPPGDFVDRAEEVLDAFGALRGAARHLSRQPGLASWFRQWARLEVEAVSLYTYECRLIPGLLQTEAYARTLFTNQMPPLGDEQIEAQWVARAERQRLLRERPNTALSFILEEHLFLRPTGGAQVIGQLIDHVLELAKLRNVEVQVMPLARTAHAGMAGPMQLLETPEARWFAYNEGQRGGMFVSEPKEVSVLQMRYARMRSQALSLDDSMGLLHQMRGAS